MVKVKPTEKYNKITVKANNETNVFSVKDNMSEYYAKLSERWASADGMVDGIDYSSKYYSNVSKECMEIVQSHRDETINTVSGFQDIVDNSKEEIEVIAQNNISNLRASAETTMSEIQETTDSSLETINNAVSENISTIESKANEALTNIETNGDETLSSIENSRSAAVSEITSLSNDYISQINNTPHITETYVNGTSWYRVWSNGWKEQGGTVSFGAYTNNMTITITLLKPFSNTNYTSLAQLKDGDAYWANVQINVNQHEGHLMITQWTDESNLNVAANKVNWYACGY